jgi:hypothetical protein
MLANVILGLSETTREARNRRGLQAPAGRTPGDSSGHAQLRRKCDGYSPQITDESPS